ncbi:MAG: hypothetical protein A2Y07_04110 [Planctomycetes bacterium GWF2_50_10]|nr:MAG: hypothetical protein A2Y07_04110 [Planctomycetes bacterium GWF2_50_10]
MRTKILLLIIISLLPAVVSLAAVNLEIYPAVTYGAGKGLMVLVPIGVWMWQRRSRGEMMRQAGLVRTSGSAGVGLGVIMAGAIIAGYYLIFRGQIEAGQVIGKLKSLGILEYYWVAAVYFSLGNAFLEEYYFRSFLVSEYMQVTDNKIYAAAANGLVFGVHHLAVLVTVVPFSFALGLSVCTAVAGFVWALLRARGVSIIDCYISHVMADLAVFYAGWQIIC